MTEIDQVRAYWDARPCNIRHGTAPTGTPWFFEQVRNRRRLVEPHILPFLGRERWWNRKVLEIGCGIGADAFEFVRSGARYVGWDLSGQSIQLARQHLHWPAALAEHNPRMAIVNIEDPPNLQPFRDGPPDLIYSFGVLHHTPNPHLALTNLRNIAGPDTELRIMLYHRWSTKALGILTTTPPWRWRGAIARRSEAQPDSPITRIYSRRQARQLLRSTGWTVTSIQTRHIFPYRIPDYVKHRYHKRLIWRVLPAPLIGRLLGWHLLIVARSQ